MNWVQAIVSISSALVGGFVGGWVVAFRMGRWRQRVEDHLEQVEKRLSVGDRALDAIPVISTRLEVLIEDVRTMRDEMRHDRARFVTHEECDRRHGESRRE